MAVYAPKLQAYAVANPERVYTARQRPTLGAVFEQLGREAAEAWVAVQLSQIFLTTGSRNMEAGEEINAFAHSFAAAAKPYTLPELQLFFGRYAAGRYDDSYSTFDARRVGMAFHNRFLPERAAEVDKYERLKAQRERERRRHKFPAGENAVSVNDRCIRQALAGDDMACEAMETREGYRRWLKREWPDFVPEAGEEENEQE